MDSYFDINAIYEKIMTLIEGGNYFFHVTDSNIEYTDISYDDFIRIVPKIEYIDSKTNNYTRIYLNPFTRTILLLCARKRYDNNGLMLIRITQKLIDSMYTMMRDGIATEYHETVEMIYRKVSELERVEYNDEIQVSAGRDGIIYDDETASAEQE